MSNHVTTIIPEVGRVPRSKELLSYNSHKQRNLMRCSCDIDAPEEYPEVNRTQKEFSRKGPRLTAQGKANGHFAKYSFYPEHTQARHVS